MQYVILTYMKHLGVKVKEPRNLEQKRGRIGFLPKIKVVVLWPECVLFKAAQHGCFVRIQNPLLHDTLEVGMILQSSLLHQEGLGLLSCTGNLTAEIGFYVCFQTRELQMSCLLSSFICMPEF